MTEYEKMQRGEVYLATDPSLLRELHACQDKCWEYNRLCPTDARRRNEMIREILGGADEDTLSTSRSIATMASISSWASASSPISTSPCSTRHG